MDVTFLRDIPNAIGKGEPLKRTRNRKRRTDAEKLETFRDAVWLREVTKANGGGLCEVDIARCQRCFELVVRTPTRLTGHVHHRISRRHKATRYDPDNGVLLCDSTVNDCHAKVEQHKAECP